MLSSQDKGIQPEVSSPPHFRIQGGSDTGQKSCVLYRIVIMNNWVLNFKALVGQNKPKTREAESSIYDIYSSLDLGLMPHL